MKNLILGIIVLGVSFSVFGKDEKKYTEAEFKAKVHEEVAKQVERIKTSSVAQLTKEILEKEQKVDAREAEIIKREDLLKINEETFAKKVLQLETDQKKIIGCVDEHNKSENRRIKQMVSVISSMKPAKAAEVLSVQDSHISVKILEQIDPQQASKIFNMMDKEVSARLQKQYLNMQK
jgi:flagellar motility protein MotE (MotC chaperone)